jgi:3-oxoacyl-[acyl-carrier protein] reductase
MSKKLQGQVAVVTVRRKESVLRLPSIWRRPARRSWSITPAARPARRRSSIVFGKRTGKAAAVQADVSKPDDVRRLFAETKKAFGKLDILVNNAGVYEFAPLEAISSDHFHKHFNLNVLGLLLTTQEAVKHFGPVGGSIINMSSFAATSAPPSTSVYSGTRRP